VSQVAPNPKSDIDALERLTPVDRAWLSERIAEYQDLLQYLHEH
jgi:hypothetical protein